MNSPNRADARPLIGGDYRDSSDAFLSKVLLFGIVVASIGFSFFVVAQGNWIDDAFISFRYARNLFEGYGLVYNSGEPVEGYTNFLWTTIAYFSLLLRFEPIYFAQAVSLAAQGLTLVIVYASGRDMGLSSLRALLAPALLGGQLPFLTYSMSGMETTFFTFLIALSFLLLQRAENARGGIAAGISLLCLALTRFDGFGLAFVLLGFAYLYQRRRLTLWPAIAILLIGLLAYNAWRISFYPTLLPNTFHAKSSFSLGSIVDGARYAARFFTEDGRSLLLLFAVVPLALLRRSPWMWCAAAVVAAQMFYVVLVGGDWMANFRFMLPALPAFFLLAQCGVFEVLDGLAKTSGRLLTGIAVLAIVLGMNVSPLLQSDSLETSLSEVSFRPDDARSIGLHLTEHLEPDAKFALEWGGILPYYIDEYVLETFGLTDLEIAFSSLPSANVGRWMTPDYLLRRNPDAVAPCLRVFSTEAQAKAAAEPGGVCHYKYYPTLLLPEYGYRVQVENVTESGYWPMYVKQQISLGFQDTIPN